MSLIYSDSQYNTTHSLHSSVSQDINFTHLYHNETLILLICFTRLICDNTLLTNFSLYAIAYTILGKGECYCQQNLLHHIVVSFSIGELCAVVCYNMFSSMLHMQWDSNKGLGTGISVQQIRIGQVRIREHWRLNSGLCQTVEGFLTELTPVKCSPFLVSWWRR